MSRLWPFRVAADRAEALPQLHEGLAFLYEGMAGEPDAALTGHAIELRDRRHADMKGAQAPALNILRPSSTKESHCRRKKNKDRDDHVLSKMCGRTRQAWRNVSLPRW